MGGGSLDEPGRALRPLLAPPSVSLGEFRRGRRVTLLEQEDRNLVF